MTSTLIEAETRLPLPLRLGEILHVDAELRADRDAVQRVRAGEFYDDATQVNCISPADAPACAIGSTTGPAQQTMDNSYSATTGMSD